MQLASSARLPDGLLAAQWLGAEKPHQGVSTQKQAWHPAPSVCNSTTALGLRAGCAGNRVRSFCSGEQFDPDLGLYYLRARYYNPATGRFLSRDPENGKPYVPATLHKYLYADGDPVNGRDPKGLADLVETEGVNSNNLKVIFGHGARHLFGTGLSQAEVEAEIETAIQEAYADEGLESCEGTAMIAVQGIPIIYRLYVVDAIKLICNVGTYFPL